MPARYAQSAPSTNDDCAPAMICFAYCGFSWAADYLRGETKVALLSAIKASA